MLIFAWFGHSKHNRAYKELQLLTWTSLGVESEPLVRRREGVGLSQSYAEGLGVIWACLNAWHTCPWTEDRWMLSPVYTGAPILTAPSTMPELLALPLCSLWPEETF